MCNRNNSQNMSLVGFGAIFVTLGSLIYLIHITHSTLEQTRERLSISDQKLQVTSKQLESLSTYTTRLEQAFINMKSEKASIIQNDQTAKQELDEERNLCAKKLRLLQADLRSCQGQRSTDLNTQDEASKIVIQNAPIVGVQDYKYSVRSEVSGGDQLKRNAGRADGVTSENVKQDPNEDLAGNVLI